MNWQQLIISLLRLSALLPLSVNHIIGKVLGGLLWIFPNKLKNIALKNISLCFPELSPNEHNRLLRRNLMETGKNLLEIGALWLWSGEHVLSLVKESDTTERILAKRAQLKKGAILITPHLGSWEMAGLYFSSRLPLTILYRPSRLAGFDAISCQGRSRLGGQVVATNMKGIRTLLRALRQGEVLGILPDQDMGGIGDGESLFAPFFNVTAGTMTLVSRLALKTKVPVFITWAERLPYGRGYIIHLHILPKVTTATSLGESVAALNQGVETAVRSLPEQYLWVYKRFKTRPPGEPKLYY